MPRLLCTTLGLCLLLARPLAGDPLVVTSGFVIFTGPRVVVPDVPGGVRGSFSLDGRIVAYLDPLRTTPAVWSADLRGSGTAVVSFQSSGFLSEVEYQFTETDPVPEPSTLVLVAAALAAGARRFTTSLRS